jgi:hypothetical protein
MNLIIEIVKVFEQPVCRVTLGSKNDCQKDFLIFVF